VTSLTGPTVQLDVATSDRTKPKKEANCKKRNEQNEKSLNDEEDEEPIYLYISQNQKPVMSTAPSSSSCRLLLSKRASLATKVGSASVKSLV
jgi:hypothetical protein